MKKVKLINRELFIQFTYDPKVVDCMRRLPPGRKWVKEFRAWTCPPSVDAICSLREWGFDLDDSVLKWEKEFLSPSTEKEQIKPILSEDIGMKKKLRPFQEYGVGFIQSRGGKVLLADEMGLGKTIQSLAWLQHNPKARPALVICPASVKGVWERECQESTNLTTHIINGWKPYSLPQADLYIINYDIVEAWTESLKAFQTIFLDECHRIKNRKAIRTKAVTSLCNKYAKHILALSGTPIVNRPIEFYSTLQLLSDRFGKFWDFAQRYCGAKHNGFGWDLTGASNTEELNRILTSSIMIRRLKKDVLVELPDKVQETIPLDVDLSYYQYAMREAKIAWQNNKTESHIQDITQIAKLRQAAVDCKFDSCCEWIDDFLENENSKLVIYCIHHKTSDRLKERYGKHCVIYDGRVPQKNRDQIVRDFQTNPKIRLFIGNIQAAGVGITLHAASNVFFIELPWTPGELDQAEDRCHRIGQKDSVNIYYAITKGTLEEDMMEIIQEKRKILGQVLDGKPPEGKEVSIFNEVVKRIRRKNG